MQYKSDKHYLHNYTLIYELIIGNLYLKRGKPISVLELGIYEGDSLLDFVGMPEVSKYVGVDSQKYFDFELPEKAGFIQREAYNPETLEILKSLAPFDLIIDDATHVEKDMRYFFDHYPVLCAKGGFMVYEEVNRRWESLAYHRKNGILFFDCSLTRTDFPLIEEEENLKRGVNSCSILGVKQL